MIEAHERKVFYAPERGRAYLTLDAACMAEARTIINQKYPNEEPDFDGEKQTSPGSVYKYDNDKGGMDYYDQLERRFANHIKRKFRREKQIKPAVDAGKGTG